ncbi:MAG: glucose-1-phosphate thymidylyltransferase [Candidatus Krumholzibacteriia bacterium]
MKALILSGGKGTRLRPITHTSAKQLVPVANRPILFYGLDAVRAAGIEEIGIVVGETHREIRDAVGDGSSFGLRVDYIQQEAPLGLAHAVKVSQDYLGDSPFVMYLGDNLIPDGITELVHEFERAECDAQILLAHVPNPSAFGVAELDSSGRVVRLEEKPKKPKSDLALVGVYMFNQTVFEVVNAIRPSARGELEITDAIQHLIDRGRSVRSHVIQGWWKDTGKLEDMLEANRIVLSGLRRRVEGSVDEASQVEGQVVLEKGARVESSVLRGPLIVGDGTVVRSSYVGPFTSIAGSCVIEDSEIEHSIVLESSHIIGIGSRIESSLVGRNVRLVRGDLRPKAYKFMVGDNSEIELF